VLSGLCGETFLENGIDFMKFHTRGSRVKEYGTQSETQGGLQPGANAESVNGHKK
jgi:hypothetical protein